MLVEHKELESRTKVTVSQQSHMMILDLQRNFKFAQLLIRIIRSIRPDPIVDARQQLFTLHAATTTHDCTM